MGDKINMALDDIIKSTRGSGRGARRGGSGGRGRGGRSSGGPRRGGRPGPRGISNGAGRSGMGAGRWTHDMYQGGSAPRPLSSAVSTSGPIKVNITNLEYGVSDSDIRELFQEFGDMKLAAVHYDRAGRSLGSAQVIFSRYSDAMKAVRQYNGVHLDGRPMKIYIEGDNSMSSGRLGGGGGGGGRAPVKRLQGGSGGGRGMRGGGGRGMRGGRGRGGRSGSDRPKPKTAEELDAELDSYVSEAQKSQKTEITL